MKTVGTWTNNVERAILSLLQVLMKAPEHVVLGYF